MSMDQPKKYWTQKAISVLVMSTMMMGQFGALAQSLPTLEKLPPSKSYASAVPVRGQISIARDVKIAPEKEKVSMSMRDANIRDVLNMLAAQGNFNLILDESIEGTLTVDIKDISINKALEYIFTVSDFTFSKDGNTLIVASSETAQERNLAAQTFKAIPVQYQNAADMANQLNTTLFSVRRPNGSRAAVAAFDGNSNSVLVMGTETDIRMVADFLREMDVPRNRKVYHIRHNTPQYVANVISANFFKPAFSGASAGGGGGVSLGGAAVGAAPAAGVGAAPAGAAPAGGAAGAAGGAGAAAGGAAVGNNADPSPIPIVLNTGGVTLIAEAVSSTLTVMGTEEQLALVDSIIDQVDVKRPQVAIEMSLVEMNVSDVKAFRPDFSAMQFGEFNLNLVDFSSATSALGWSNNGSRAPATTRNRAFPLTSFNITHQFNTDRVKVLANPTVVALDGQSANINVTDQIATVNETVVTSGGASTTTATITTTPVGITLQVIPTIFKDGSVVMNLQPTLSIPGIEVTAGGGSVTRTTLVSTRSVNLAGVRVRDGQTLVIGGLLNNRETESLRKVPGLSSVPVFGGLFKTIGPNAHNRTELVMLVTPHIVKDEGVAYFANPPQPQSHYSNPNQGNIQPVSLPKFIGAEDNKEVRPGFFPWSKFNKANKQSASSETAVKSETDIKNAEPLEAKMNLDLHQIDAVTTKPLSQQKPQPAPAVTKKPVPVAVVKPKAFQVKSTASRRVELEEPEALEELVK